MKLPTIVATSLFMALSAPDVFATSMRCGGKLVEIGDNEYQVLNKCGRPTYEHGNRWIYDRGPGRFLKILVFGANGKLVPFQQVGTALARSLSNRADPSCPLDKSAATAVVHPMQRAVNRILDGRRKKVQW